MLDLLIVFLKNNGYYLNIILMILDSKNSKTFKNIEKNMRKSIFSILFLMIRIHLRIKIVRNKKEWSTI